MAFLTGTEIGDLDELFIVAFHTVESLRNRAPVGKAIPAVKVPPRLSESIVAENCRLVFGQGTVLLPRCGRHDVTVRTRRRLNVAVKGSGLTDWAVITPTDRLADVLVWVDYRDRLLDPMAPVIVRRIPIARLASVSTRAFLRPLAAGCPAVSVWPR